MNGRAFINSGSSDRADTIPSDSVRLVAPRWKACMEESAFVRKDLCRAALAAGTLAVGAAFAGCAGWQVEPRRFSSSSSFLLP
jgi:hypothetical protein